MANNGTKPDELELFNSIFGADEDEQPTAQSQPKPQPQSQVQNKPQKPKEESPPSWEDDILAEFKQVQEESRAENKNIKQQETFQTEPEQKPEQMAEKNTDENLDIDDLFSEITEADGREDQKSQQTIQQPVQQPAPQPQPQPTPVQQPARRQEEYVQPQQPRQEEERRIQPSGPVRPIKRHVSSKSLEQILGNIVNQGEAPQQPASTVTASLVSLTTGSVVPIGGNVVIGSSNVQSNVTITGNPTISRRHAAIELRDDEFYIRDLGSLNGTRINGKQLKENHEHKLADGDKIMISNEPFEFRK